VLDYTSFIDWFFRSGDVIPLKVMASTYAKVIVIVRAMRAYAI